MARTDTLPHFLTDLADSIRQKTGETGKISPDNMDVVVKSIPSGDVSDYFADTSSSYWAQTFIKRMPPITLSSGYQSFKDFRQLEEMPVIKNCSELRTFSQMFYYCEKLKNISLDGSNSNNYDDIFSNCSELESVKITNFGKNISTRTINCQSMFNYCSKLTSIDAEIDFSKITLANNMFNNCKELSDLDHLQKNVLKNTSSYNGECKNMFLNCMKLQGTLNLDFTNATSLNSMFSSCTSLTRVENFKNEKCTKFETVFSYCTNLQYADLSGIKCSNVTSIYNIVANCTNLTYLDIRNIRPSTSSFANLNAFYKVPKTCEIYINQELYDKVSSLLNGYTNVHIVAGYWE